MRNLTRRQRWFIAALAAAALVAVYSNAVHPDPLGVVFSATPASSNTVLVVVSNTSDQSLNYQVHLRYLVQVADDTYNMFEPSDPRLYGTLRGHRISNVLVPVTWEGACEISISYYRSSYYSTSGKIRQQVAAWAECRQWERLAYWVYPDAALDQTEPINLIGNRPQPPGKP
jgi:hypothetical protein